MIYALLLGRKGSVGFPGKNLYKINGRPLAWYPMKAAEFSKYIDATYISTDDEKLIRLAECNKVGVIKRPKRLCTAKALGEDAFVHGYKRIKRLNKNEEIEFMALLFCNSPTLTSDIIDRGIEILREHPEYDSAVTVSRYNMWSPLRARKIGQDGLLHPFVPLKALGSFGKLNCDRDSQGDVYFHDVGVSIVRPYCLDNVEGGLLPQKWMGKKIYPLIQEAGLDIDYEWQIPQAADWINRHWRK